MAEQNSANIGLEKQIWDTACVLRGNLDASEYKQVVLTPNINQANVVIMRSTLQGGIFADLYFVSSESKSNIRLTMKDRDIVIKAL